MSVPTKCAVLVVGGGPAGSYAAAALAREGIDTVLLEADNFPRYHVGESMLPSMRHFLRFIDLESTFHNHGFQIKKGATFKLNGARDATHTHFVAAEPNAYTWNVVRSEADDLLFRHAGKSGAQTFDGTKVYSLAFLSPQGGNHVDHFDTNHPTKAVSAEWSRKDGSSGRIEFDQLIDASGRYGLMSAKYLKNRKYNQGLKHIANWAYWRGANTYGVGIHEEGYPYFEHLQDKSGWVWFIPLHNGTTSIGVVMKQDAATANKRPLNSPTTMEFYLETIRKQCPGIQELLSKAELVDDKIHSASDWSYSAESYASPNVRIAGDAGCFIDPFFSSGVHIALTTGLAAAATIAGVRRGDCDEETAGQWYTAKVQEVYTRFYLVVTSAITQIRQGDVNILGDIDETGFNSAFAHFRPIIHGTADVRPELTEEELTKMIKFCGLAFEHTENKKQEEVLEKVKTAQSHGLSIDDNGANGLSQILTPDEMRVLGTVRGRELIKHENILDLGAISLDPINGRTVNVKRGELGLKHHVPVADQKRKDGLGLMMGEGSWNKPVDLVA